MMSTAPTHPRQAARPPRGKIQSVLAYLFTPHGKPGEIVIISHSNLFYWWPVWLVGFIMVALTYFDGHRLAIVPGETNAYANAEVRLPEEKSRGETVQRTVHRDVLVAPEGKSLPTKFDESGRLEQPRLRMALSRTYGVLFLLVLILVIFITNVPLRGLWSLFAIIFIILLSVIFAQAGIWETIVSSSKLLAVHINLAGYFVLSLVLFIIWLVNFFFFDRQFYMIFTPGQVRVHLEIGAGETVYDTVGMVFQKQRSDLFRHWILGFGSGDLIVRPAGGTQHIDLPNVLSVGRRIREIEKKLAEKEVVPA
jgi:hypothetical protein